MLKEVDEIKEEVKEEIPVVATGEEIMTAENGEDIADLEVIEEVKEVYGEVPEEVEEKPEDHSPVEE